MLPTQIIAPRERENHLGHLLLRHAALPFYKICGRQRSRITIKSDHQVRLHSTVKLNFLWHKWKLLVVYNEGSVKLILTTSPLFFPSYTRIVNRSFLSSLPEDIYEDMRLVCWVGGQPTNHFNFYSSCLSFILFILKINGNDNLRFNLRVTINMGIDIDGFRY